MNWNLSNENIKVHIPRNPILVHQKVMNILTDGAWRRSVHVLHGIRCVDSQVARHFRWLVPVDLDQSSHSVLYEQSQLYSVSPYPTSPASFIPAAPPFHRPWRVSSPRPLKFYTRAPSFCPGRSSLDFGHSGVVLGQNLHQFVSPVERVPEPAQLSRDIRGGGDLCGKQITSHL